MVTGLSLRVRRNRTAAQTEWYCYTVRAGDPIAVDISDCQPAVYLRGCGRTDCAVPVQAGLRVYVAEFKGGGERLVRRGDCWRKANDDKDGKSHCSYDCGSLDRTLLYLQWLAYARLPLSEHSHTSTISRIGTNARNTIYPRVCGGTTASSVAASAGQGLSPRVRGNHAICFVALPAVGSIPACAGEPAFTAAVLAVVMVYPRVYEGTMPSVSLLCQP